MAKEDILIRVLGIANQRVKMVFPSIANNKQLMKNMGFVISDPNYDTKMDAIKNKKPFSENGVAKEPVKEAFAPTIVTKPEPIIEQPKNSISVTGDISKISQGMPKERIEAEITVRVPNKRIRRTKEQIAFDNAQIVAKQISK